MRRKDATGRVIGTHVDPYTDKPWDELAELLDQETALIDTLMLNVAVQRHALRLRRYAPHAHTPAEAAELLRRTGTWAPDGPFA